MGHEPCLRAGCCAVMRPSQFSRSFLRRYCWRIRAKGSQFLRRDRQGRSRTGAAWRSKGGSLNYHRRSNSNVSTAGVLHPHSGRERQTPCS